MKEKINIFENSDLKKIRSFTQFPTKIITGVRGTGKSVVIQKDDLAKDYFNYGDYFMVFRESQVEVDAVKRDGFFDLVIQEQYPDHVFTQDGNRILIDGICVGMIGALSTIGHVRGVTFTNFGKLRYSKKTLEELEIEVENIEKFIKKKKSQVNKIFFDEFIPLTPQMSDSNRVYLFQHVCETLFRFREGVKVYLAGNLTSPNNAFLQLYNFPLTQTIEYGIKKSYSNPDSDGKRHPLAVWLNIKPSAAWKKAREKSYVGLLNLGKNDSMFSGGELEIGYREIGQIKQRRLLFNLTDGAREISLYKTLDGMELNAIARTKNKTFPTYCLNRALVNKNVSMIAKQFKDNIIEFWEHNRILYDNDLSFQIMKNIITNKRG